MYKAIVIAPKGINIYDRPAAQAKGAIKRRSEPNGKHLIVETFFNIEGVPYAALVPQNPDKPEYIRIAERDGSIKYVELVDLASDQQELITAIRELTEALKATSHN
jgi:hypothetical protein